MMLVINLNQGELSDLLGPNGAGKQPFLYDGIS